MADPDTGNPTVIGRPDRIRVTPRRPRAHGHLMARKAGRWGRHRRPELPPAGALQANGDATAADHHGTGEPPPSDLSRRPRQPAGDGDSATIRPPRTSPLRPPPRQRPQAFRGRSETPLCACSLRMRGRRDAAGRCSVSSGWGVAGRLSREPTRTRSRFLAAIGQALHVRTVGFGGCLDASARRRLAGPLPLGAARSTLRKSRSRGQQSASRAPLVAAFSLGSAATARDSLPLVVRADEPLPLQLLPRRDLLQR